MRLEAVWLALLAAAMTTVAETPDSLRVEVSEAWIRALPGDLPAAGYARVANRGSSAVTLIGIETPDYATAMMHESRAERGMDRMLPLERLVIAPHASVAFAPGGYHIMLMQPQRALAVGARVMVTLRFTGVFKGVQTLAVPFEVRGPAG